MRRLTLLTTALLCSSTFAATAAADTLSESGLCRKLEARLERCDGEGRLSRETRGSCDRVEHGFRALCGDLGTINASESADSAALDLLDEDYEVVPIENANADAFPNHVVIGPSDLDDPDVIAPLRDAYAVGRTVAITGATEEEARRFHRLIRLGQELDCAAPGPRGSEIALYGLQRSLNPAQEASYCLQGLDEGDPAADRQWLRGRFAPMPPSRVSSGALTDDPLPQLTQLAGSKACYFKAGPSVGNVSWTIDVWSVRNFEDEGFCKNSCTPENRGADYYLVNFNPSLTPEVRNITQYTVAARRLTEASSGDDLDMAFVILTDTAPDSNPSATTYMTGRSTTISGSVGVSITKKGPALNVTAGGSITTLHTKTVTIPPVMISNTSDTPTAEPGWTFTPHSTTIGDTYNPSTAWLWIVGRQAYPSGGTGNEQVSFHAGANIFASTGSTDFFPSCNVPYPFTAWTVAQPQLSMLDPSSTSRNGGIFVIDGQFLYPSSVAAVLVAGDPIPLSTNVDLVGNKEIKVVVPASLMLPLGVNEVQVNTQFNGQDRFSNQLNLTLTE